jgi:dipeptidyl aminopeptidase/acylaminoacyl peptidase
MRKISIVLSLALAFVLTPVAFAQTTQTAAQSAPAAPPKRPMTFEDMMKMKRLGETAVSPDGKWLAYSVTTVDLEQNTKTPELWLQAIAGGEPMKIAVAQPGDAGIQFAPDSKRILFLSGRGGSEQVWLADFDAATGATANAKKLTAISTEAGDAIWSPDGNSILFTSAVYPDCPAITVADGVTGDKCNAERDAAQAASKVKAQIFTHLLYRHWDHFTGEKRTHLFLATVGTGAVRDLTPNDPHDVPPFSLEGGGCGCAFAPDGKELAFTENIDPEPAISVSAKIFTLDLTDAAAKPVKVSTSKGGNFNPAYSPDGKYLAWRSQERAGYESDKFRLVVYDRTAKTTKDVLPDAKLRGSRIPANFDYWVDEFVWIDDSLHILFISSDKGKSTAYYTYISGDDFSREGRVAGSWSDIHALLYKGYERIIGAYMRVGQPPEVVMGDLVQMYDDTREIWKDPAKCAKLTKCSTYEEFKACNDSARDITKPIIEPEYLTHLNDDLLNQLDLPKMEDFWFIAADGTKLQGFLIRPPGFDAAKKYPVKFLIHGGPQGAWGDDWSYRWNAELFAANGYVVVMINPRGSTGYGQAIVDGVNGDWGGKPFTDLMEGLDYAEQHYPFIDKTRECALGASYGGYMANWVEGHTDRFKCIVSHDGMFNPESAYGTTEELWFNEWEFKGRPWDYYGKPDAENPYRKWSPALAAKNFKTPMLVVHGQLDYRLDVSEGYQMFTTLQRLKVPSKMLYFPDEGHWVLKPQNSRLWWKTVNDWVDEWTGKAGTSHPSE